MLDHAKTIIELRNLSHLERDEWFKAKLKDIGFSKRRFANFIGVTEKTCYRWHRTSYPDYALAYLLVYDEKAKAANAAEVRENLQDG